MSIQKEIVASSSSRPHAKPRREVRRSRRERLNRDKEEKDEEEEWQERQLASRKPNGRVRPYHGTSPTPQRGSPQHPRRHVSPRLKKLSPQVTSRHGYGTMSPPRSHTPPLDELASIDGGSNGDASTEGRQERHDRDQDQEPAPPPPLPRALHRQPSSTMPGALFPRSPSLVPDAQSLAAVARHVHFFPAQPAYFDFEAPVPGPSSPPEPARPPSSIIPRGARSRTGSVSSDTSGRRAWEGGTVRAGDVVASGPSGPSWKEKGKQRATAAADVVLKSEASSSPARPIGTGRARDAGPEPVSADTSGEIRVRGKVRELSAVREERRAREQWWESEVETTVIREEKADYEEKIKRLEEEVQRLTAEVRVYFSPVYDVPSVF